MPATRTTFAAAVVLAQLAYADLSILCKPSADTEFPEETTTYDQYELTDSTQTCVAFELMCVEELTVATETSYSLISTEASQAKTCVSEGTCVCNFQHEAWTDASKWNQDEGFPAAMRQTLPAGSASPANGSQDALLRQELETGGAARVQRTIYHEMNANAEDKFVMSQDVATIEVNCPTTPTIGQINCNLYYELDWALKLETQLDCSEVVAKDPCFGTSACICDTGYFKILEDMPTTRPASVGASITNFALKFSQGETELMRDKLATSQDEKAELETAKTQAEEEKDTAIDEKLEAERQTELAKTAQVEAETAKSSTYAALLTTEQERDAALLVAEATQVSLDAATLEAKAAREAQALAERELSAELAKDENRGTFSLIAGGFGAAIVVGLLGIVIYSLVRKYRQEEKKKRLAAGSDGGAKHDRD